MPFPTDVENSQTFTTVRPKRLTDALPDWRSRGDRHHEPRTDHLVVGVLPGEGVGPEVVAAALDILRVIEDCTPLGFELRHDGPIGAEAERICGLSLPLQVEQFCSSVFADGGAVLCGPGGKRFVYDLRRRFDLFCKFTPLKPNPALVDTGVVRPEARRDVDLVIVRENISGAYFGTWDQTTVNGQGTRARHEFSYSRDEVKRIVEVAVRTAMDRSGRLSVVLKPYGIPAISQLWTDVVRELAAPHALELNILEVDNAAYQIIANASAFDVIVAPNLFGDIISDAATVLLGSRGMSYSGNFGPEDRSVFQTGHGSAHDLAGRDVANPIGQICSTAMMLRETFGRHEIADSVEQAIGRTLAAGVRTPDIATPDAEVVGTREMGRRIAETLREILVHPSCST